MTNKRRAGRPLKMKKDKRSVCVQTYVTPADYTQLLSEKDEQTYATNAEYFRARLLDKSITKRVKYDNLEQLELALVDSTEELHKLGVNINQIAKHFNTYKSPAFKKEILELLKLFLATQKTIAIMQKGIHEIHEKW